MTLYGSEKNKGKNKWNELLCMVVKKTREKTKWNELLCMVVKKTREKQSEMNDFVWWWKKTREKTKWNDFKKNEFLSCFRFDFRAQTQVKSINNTVH